MPRKTRIQKDDLIEAGLELIRKEGWHVIGIRSLAREVGCSTQPVISHFPTLPALQHTLWQAASDLQEKMLMEVNGDEPFLIQIGENYVRFAIEEPRLFQTIFDSDWNQPASLSTMLEDPALEPILAGIMNESGLEKAQALQAFEILSMFLHGYASLAASGQMKADLQAFRSDLILLFESLQARLTSDSVRS